MRQHEEEGTREDLVAYRLETAENDLKSARLLFEHDDYKGANNRAYYSIFHAIKAVLATETIDFKRHKDVIAYFNRKYVKDNIFPRSIGRRIVETEEIRHVSDYDDFYIASKTESEEALTTAKDLLDLVKQYCEAWMQENSV